jgi:hypothetical protein
MDCPFDEPIQEKDAHMLELIKLSIEAHGGFDRWNQVRQISATFAPGGIGLKQRGQEAFTRMPTRVTWIRASKKRFFDRFWLPSSSAFSNQIARPSRPAMALFWKS